MESLKSPLHLAQKDPKSFLSELVFQNLYVEEFKFAQGTSGNLGSNMISQHDVVPIQAQGGALQPVARGIQLAIHLNCVVTASALQKNTIPIRVELFHITARSLARQLLIDGNGPSITTADNSIHMGINTEWSSRPENLTALAQEVGINEDETLLRELELKAGYNGAYMRFLMKKFREKVELRIHEYLGGDVVVKWDGDKSFPTE